jgi:energy-coupling factor transport system ATP-binding protein
MSTRILVDKLSYTYQGNLSPSLDGINLEIKNAEFIAIIGQNGSGKTTLVKHFNGLLMPTKGRVLVDGVDTKGRSIGELSRKVGYLFQNPDHQIFCSTVEKEVAFGPENMGLSKDEVTTRVKEALELVGLEEHANIPPSMLGLGQRRKVTLASVVAMQPEVMVLDEPTCGIDHRGSTDLMEKVKGLNSRGHIIIMITHDMRIVSEYAKKTIVLWNGKILLEDTTRNVFSQPDILAKTFLAPPQIMLLSRMLEEYGMRRDVLTVREFYEQLTEKMRC